MSRWLVSVVDLPINCQAYLTLGRCWKPKVRMPIGSWSGRWWYWLVFGACQNGCWCARCVGGRLVACHLPLPLNSLSTASPMQCLLAAAGVTGCRKAPILNLWGRLLYNPTVDQAEEEDTPNGCESGRGCTRLMWPNGGSGGRGEFPTAVKAEEVAQDLCNPTVDQAEEEETPNGCDSGWGRTSYILSQRWIRRKRRRFPTAVKAEEDLHEYIWPNGGTGRRGESSQWLWRRMRSHIVPLLRRKPG